MLLCDRLIYCAHWGDNPSKIGVPLSVVGLPVVGAHVAQMKAMVVDLKTAPRFVLSDEVVGAATHLVLSRPHSICSAVEVLRIPYPTMWVEWLSEPRRLMRNAMGVSVENNKSHPHRMGFLIRSDESGRRGVMEFVWHHDDPNGEAGMLPQICPMIANFDLDRLNDASIPFHAKDIERVPESYRHWQNNPQEAEALHKLNRVAVERVSEEGKNCIMASIQSMPDADPMEMTRLFLGNAHDDLEGEFLASLGILMLLSARNAVENRAEDRTKLNKARRKNGDPLLLDHIVSYLKLSKGERTRGLRLGDGAVGGAFGRRPHVVRGHLVTRGQSIFWRRAHMRCLDGESVMPIRTIKVSL